MLIPAIRATLALPLLVPRVLADHQDRPVSADYLALLAHWLDGSSDLHRSGFRIDNRIPTRPMNRTVGRTNRPTRPTGKDSRGDASAMPGAVRRFYARRERSGSHRSPCHRRSEWWWR